ncbi:MAG: prolyl oligopeptidase family serine peptidase [Bacteroidota bacterium]|nr:prolyl oligopeptidase family serine peptidase [Bacteroidota bacterium]
MILSEEDIQLSDKQIKFVKGGWGIEVAEDTIVKKIIYESDGLEVSGFLAHPKNIIQKYPLIIWNRGGNCKEGMIDDFLAKGIFGEIASWGYVVLASQYREKDEFGGKDVNDVLNLIPVAENISFCESGKIGIEGWSRGGMMAYIVLTLTKSIKCAVIISGLADLFRSEESRSDLVKVYEKLFGSHDENEFIERKKKRSAVYFAFKINKATKILLIHGTSDKRVSHQDSVDMYERLKENGIPCELKLIENGDHYLKKNREEIVKLRRDWFDKFLKN